MVAQAKVTILLCGPPLSALGGGPTHMRNLLASPLQGSYRLVHFESGSRGTESPARDEGAAAKLFRLVTSPFVLAYRIVRLRPAVVHLNSVLDNKAFWRDLSYLFVSKLLFRRVVVQLHGGSLHDLYRGPLLRFLVRVFLSLPDAVVLLATSEQRDLDKAGLGRRAVVIPNAVDLSEYRRADGREHSGRVRRMVFMARLVHTKGVFEAMEAVRLLHAESDFADIELLIAGSGPETGAIEKWIERHGMQRSVRLVGPLYGNDKVDFLREADVFVFPTYHREGLPYSIIESIAAGTPVIATRVAGIPDVIVDRTHGILIDAKDPDQIVAAVKELARSSDDLRTMCRNCRSRAIKFGLDRLAGQFGELYERVRL